MGSEMCIRDRGIPYASRDSGVPGAAGVPTTGAGCSFLLLICILLCDMGTFFDRPLFLALLPASLDPSCSCRSLLTAVKLARVSEPCDAAT